MPAEVLNGAFRLFLMLVEGFGKNMMPQWTARSTVLLKFLVLKVAPLFSGHRLYAHAKESHVEYTASLRAVSERLALGDAEFVFRRDR